MRVRRAKRVKERALEYGWGAPYLVGPRKNKLAFSGAPSDKGCPAGKARGASNIQIYARSMNDEQRSQASKNGELFLPGP